MHALPIHSTLVFPLSFKIFITVDSFSTDCGIDMDHAFV